jgi:hypothetical protein
MVPGSRQSARMRAGTPNDSNRHTERQQPDRA